MQPFLPRVFLVCIATTMSLYTLREASDGAARFPSMFSWYVDLQDKIIAHDSSVGQGTNTCNPGDRVKVYWTVPYGTWTLTSNGL